VEFRFMFIIYILSSTNELEQTIPTIPNT